MQHPIFWCSVFESLNSFIPCCWWHLWSFWSDLVTLDCCFYLSWQLFVPKDIETRESQRLWCLGCFTHHLNGADTSDSSMIGSVKTWSLRRRLRSSLDCSSFPEIVLSCDESHDDKKDEEGLDSGHDVLVDSNFVKTTKYSTVVCAMFAYKEQVSCCWLDEGRGGWAQTMLMTFSE